MLTRVVFCLCLWICALPAHAQNRAAVEAQYQNWLTQTVWPRARRAGVSQGTFRNAFDGVRLNWDLPDLVPPGAAPPKQQRQRQAEFGNPAKYFSRGGLDGATTQGRRMAARHAQALARAEQTYGVPGRIILGIWGRESAYGAAPIPHNAFEVLGTKGFMSTRAPYFTDELIALLQIAEARHAPAGQMRSSWAGALGQPQFMPSNFLKYAADGNGDGRADIWQSEADTIASIARYLQAHGWQSGRDWGFEVEVPSSVSCAMEGPDGMRPIADWVKMGITRVGGKTFPAAELRAKGSLLMPAGRYGPAFIVTPNFYVLKDYNTSDLYALFVGHVGDRIQYGMGDFNGSWRQTGALLRSDVAQMQRALERMGHDVGGADGLAGFKTRRSIGKWQQASGQPATCWPTPEMRKTLR
ncbi:lytic murein transglycosylase [Sagittula sp. SSi028]|uniref:lytic murein transglycosylase n=1 Tax=Sagittula sp. SSi028 TaxID=3400636 RepID=UPI003AF78A04